MSLSALQLGLYLGKVYPTRAPRSIVNAVQEVSVEHGEQAGGQGFSIRLKADRGSLAAQEYALLTESLQTGYCRSPSRSMPPQVLMMAHSQIQPSPQGTQAGTITVTGKDIGSHRPGNANIPPPVPSVTLQSPLSWPSTGPGFDPASHPTFERGDHMPTERLRFRKVPT
jgi:hypothetical protein